MEGKKCGLDITVLEGLKAEGPVVSSGLVDNYKCKLVTADRDAVTEDNIHVDDVEVLGRKSIDWFTASCLGNGCVGTKGEGELASVAEDTAIGCGDNMLVILKLMTTGQSIELLRGEHRFRVRRVRGVAWADGWEARLRVMEVGLILFSDMQSSSLGALHTLVASAGGVELSSWESGVEMAACSRE